MGSLASTELEQSAASPRHVADTVRLMIRKMLGASPDAREQHLSRSELAERLRLNSPQLVKEIYDTALRQIQYETGRQTRLDSKANALLTAAGLSLTVAFTFGGQVLMAKADEFRSAGVDRWHTILAIFALSVITGLASSLIAVLALRVSNGYRTTNEQDVFNDGVLRKADQEESEDAGLAHYRRFMIIQLWEIARTHERAHESKARLIQWGQGFFMSFLVGLMIIGIVMVTSIKW